MKHLLLLLFTLPLFAAAQQSHPIIDSLKKEITLAKTDKEKITLLGDLSQILMRMDRPQAEVYAQQMTEIAELSRDRKLIIRALILNGRKEAVLGGFKGAIDKAIAHYNEALSIARQNKLDEETASAYLALSGAYRSIPNVDRALSYSNEANSYISTLNNDSLKVLGFLEQGAVYTARREKLLALRNFLAGLRLSEEKGLERLQRQSYSSLSGFYASIEDYDRAIDYAVKTMGVRRKMAEPRGHYNIVDDLTNIGNLYGYKKSYDMAVFYFQKAIKLADSLKFPPLKMGPYIGMLNNYLYASQPQKALEFFNKSTELKAYLDGFGYKGIVDQAYGYIYTDLHQFDSAFHYYKKAGPLFENSLNNASRYSYYVQMGRLNKLAGILPASISYYTKAADLAKEMADMKAAEVVVKELDTLYRRTGNYETALQMTALSFQYKDSLDKLGKEKDLMQIEAADEQERQKRLDAVKLEQKEKRHRIQYMGITIAITGSFVLLAMTGFFKVSPKVIRLVGFFSFLMFFEFLFLIFKKSIATITQGEPWKDLAFMIALAAVLLPLHHWVEEKVMHLLTQRREQRLQRSGKGSILVHKEKELVAEV
ncbi:MAG: tetratricopeptide repeat protein [Flaviaesturariibacter sp.]|nr:tetratricopeptide repeat protein [Flaviaesturariibacter sp.]